MTLAETLDLNAEMDAREARNAEGSSKLVAYQGKKGEQGEM